MQSFGETFVFVAFLDHMHQHSVNYLYLILVCTISKIETMDIIGFVVDLTIDFCNAKILFG